MQHILIKHLSFLKEGYYFDRDKKTIVFVSNPIIFILENRSFFEGSHNNIIQHIKSNKLVMQKKIEFATIIPYNIFTCYWHFNIQSNMIISIEAYLRSENQDVNTWFDYLNKDK
jgi:hypothetical protein